MIGELFGKMFGTDKALTAMVDNVSAGIDKLFYTDEEKAEDGAKARSEARAMVVKWMASTQGQNVARRFIAISVTGVWLFQYVVGWLMDMASVFVSAAASAKLTQASLVTSERADTMVPAVMLILGFYFAAPHMGDLAKAAIEKFGGARPGRVERAG